VKIQYSKQLFTGLICMIFLIGIGFAGYIQSAYAEPSDDVAGKASRQLKDAPVGKNASRAKDAPADTKPGAEGGESNREKDVSEASATVEVPEDLENTVIPGGKAGETSNSKDLPEKPVQNGKLVLNFDSAELSEVIRTLAELLL